MSKRTYKYNIFSYFCVYTIDDIASELKIHPQTVRKWIKKYDLKAIDTRQPILIRGYDLIEFLKAQNDKGKFPTEFDEMHCFCCHNTRNIYQKKIGIEHKNKVLKVFSHCRTCKSIMFKNYKFSDFSKLKRIFHVVEVSELYDYEKPTCKTHISNHIHFNSSESGQGDFFDEK